MLIRIPREYALALAEIRIIRSQGHKRSARLIELLSAVEAWECVTCQPLHR